jgi:hypothetical protein
MLLLLLRLKVGLLEIQEEEQPATVSLPCEQKSWTCTYPSDQRPPLRGPTHE